MASKTRDTTEMNASVERMRQSCVLKPFLVFKKPEGPRQVRLLEIRRSLESKTRVVSR